jgi:dihydrofolate reductase
MSVRLMVAAAENDVIGRGDEIPWRLTADLRRFASLTRGHAVVLGRRTHESIVARAGRPLPGRHCIVVSSRALGAQPDGVEVVTSADGAAHRAEEVCREFGVEDWFVIGGASIYQQLLDRVDVIDLTRVHAEVGGDIRMPTGWLDGFTTCSSEPGIDQAAGLDYTFLRLVRESRQ